MEKVERDSYINSAIDNGINNVAVISSVSGVINKSEELGFVPEQLEKMFITIINSKTTAPEEFDNSLSSSMLRENGIGKLIAALRDGIKKEEVAASLSKATITGNQNDLNFQTLLFAHMKRKENVIKKNSDQIDNKAPSYQKINTMS